MPDKGDVDDLTREFIAESVEGLDRMERCLTELEVRPEDGELVAEIFRAVHTIKGTTGFLGFARLEKLAHAGENLLGSLREGRLAVSEELVSGLLQLMDTLRNILRLIEVTGGEGHRACDDDSELIALLVELNGDSLSGDLSGEPGFELRAEEIAAEAQVALLLQARSLRACWCAEWKRRGSWVLLLSASRWAGVRSRCGLGWRC